MSARRSPAYRMLIALRRPAPDADAKFRAWGADVAWLALDPILSPTARRREIARFVRLADDLDGPLLAGRLARHVARWRAERVISEKR